MSSFFFLSTIDFDSIEKRRERTNKDKENSSEELLPPYSPLGIKKYHPISRVSDPDPDPDPHGSA